MDGAGSILFWGYSPSLDLQTFLPETTAKLLLIGSGDIRHVLHTCAQTTRPMQIFLLESQLEIYARQLLFLQLIWRSNEQLGLQEKCEHYLELFGNLMLNSHTEEYLKRSASELIELITKLDGKFPLASGVSVDCSLLKFKEKDFLEGIFQFWRGKQPFPGQRAWEGRVRQYLAARFDTRQNAFDWDLHMKLAERGFKRLNTHEYSEWRETGLAFRLTRQDYTEVNRTLSSAFVFQTSDGSKQARRGYWGDILCGPFLAHGYLPIDDADPENEKKANDKFIKTATDLSEYNVLKLLAKLHEDQRQIEFVLLPLNSIGDLCSGTKERYRQLNFDLIYFGCSLTHLLNDQAKEISTNLLRRNGALILELPIFLLDLNVEQIEQLIRRYDQMAKDLHCQPVDESKDRAMKFYRSIPREEK